MHVDVLGCFHSEVLAWSALSRAVMPKGEMRLSS